MKAYRLEPVSGDQIVARVAELAPVYRDCFSEPPWNPAAEKFETYPAKLRDQMAHPGAAGILATADNEVAGAIYGWPAPPEPPTGTPFDDALLAAAPAGSMAALIAPALVVVELMVAPTHRRRGLATRLLAAYTDRVPGAWLCTHPEAPAAQLYQRLGWRSVFTFAYRDTPYEVFVTAGSRIDTHSRPHAPSPHRDASAGLL